MSRLLPIRRRPYTTAIRNCGVRLKWFSRSNSFFRPMKFILRQYRPFFVKIRPIVALPMAMGRILLATRAPADLVGDGWPRMVGILHRYWCRGWTELADWHSPLGQTTQSFSRFP